MLVPSILGKDMFDDFFGFPFYDDKDYRKMEKKLYGQEDVKGEFKHGILKLFIPKIERKPAIEEKKYITIE